MNEPTTKNSIWGNFDIGKVVNAGFKLEYVAPTNQGQNEVIQAGIYHFYSKPFIVKAWHADMDFSLEELHTVPIWIKLPGLDFKYWSPKGLSKLGSLIGKPLMVDQNTERKIGLNFARLMVEVDMNAALPDIINFRNENGQLIEQKGGLNIKGCENWNEASVGNFWDHKAPADSSWYWRKLNSLKTKMQHWYTQGQLNLTANATQKRLLTKERLIQVATTECCLCQEAVLETNKHLFVECEYVTRVRTTLLSWTNTPMTTIDLSPTLEMIRKKHWKKFKKEVIAALWGAMVYHVWKARNWKHFKGTSIQHADIVGNITREIEFLNRGNPPSYGMKGGAHSL
ncbi:hypothetical protein KY285_037237 [Solanum tuberosum]|nr:hypothetical protein KY285_037237 [Solanum tuberosum]